MTRGTRTALGWAGSAAGVALLVWYLRKVGLDRIATGLSAVGAGLLVLLAISLARFALRTAAWMTLIGATPGIRGPVLFRRGLGAMIGGDALGNLTPIGVMVSEPAKALHLGDAVPAAHGFAALMAENFFYAISIAAYILLGAAAMLEAFALPPFVRLAGIWSLAAMAAALLTAGWMAWQKPAIASTLVARLAWPERGRGPWPGTRRGPGPRLAAVVDRVREFEVRTYGAAGRQGARLGVVVLCETTFHMLSFAETWYTLWLLTGASHPLEAFVLDSVSRVSNIVFRVIPLRLGLDQAGSGMVAQAIGLDPAIGATLSVVRTGRVLVWAIVGLGLVGRRGWSRVHGRVGE